METSEAKKKRKRPLMLTERDEKILRAVYAYRYMTILDLAWFLFKPSSKTHVGEIAAKLAGGKDLQTHSYLCRFGLPSVGNAERVYTLGAKGRSYLSERGLPITWYFRPYKLRHFSHAHIQHNLLITRVVVAAHVWSRKQQVFSLVEVRFGHQLAGAPQRVRQNGEGKVVPVVPDAWLLFERDSNGSQIPIFLEIDRGNEFQKRFKAHVRSRQLFVAVGKYAKLFGVQSVRFAYVTTGQTSEYREARRKSMCVWTMDVLKELGAEDWAQNFCYASIEYAGLFDLMLFEKPVWYRPDSPTPGTLLPS
jgi:hypothetical protein